MAITDPENWIGLTAFLVTALTTGQLSSRAKRRAEEAEQLYRKLEKAFEKASQAEALRRSEKLKSALLDAVTHDLRTPLTSIKASVTHRARFHLYNGHEHHRATGRDKNRFVFHFRDCSRVVRLARSALDRAARRTNRI